MEKQKIEPLPSPLPAGFTLQDSASPLANHGVGKIFCDRKDICNECEHIQNHRRHFIENVTPIIEYFKSDLNKINEVKIAMHEADNVKNFSVEFNGPKSVIKHFETCHLCYRLWNHPFRMEWIICYIEQERYSRNKKGLGRRGKR